MPTATSAMAASRSCGGKRSRSIARRARNASPMNSTTAPSRATVFPPSSQVRARSTAASRAVGARGAAASDAGGGESQPGALSPARSGGATSMLASGATSASLVRVASGGAHGARGSGDGLRAGELAAAPRASSSDATRRSTAERSVQPASPPSIAPRMRPEPPAWPANKPKSAPQNTPHTTIVGSSRHGAAPGTPAWACEPGPDP